jgi:hypothetical protein
MRTRVDAERGVFVPTQSVGTRKAPGFTTWRLRHTIRNRPIRERNPEPGLHWHRIQVLRYALALTGKSLDIAVDALLGER